MKAGKYNSRTTPEYRVWANIKQRCLNPKHPHFAYYGGRGVTICSRWIDSFDNFYEDMGARPTPKHTVERKETDGHYEPGNCEWATMAVQSANRRNVHKLEWQGRTWTLAALAREVGIERSLFDARLNRLGWPLERAVVK